MCLATVRQPSAAALASTTSRRVAYGRRRSLQHPAPLVITPRCTTVRSPVFFHLPAQPSPECQRCGQKEQDCRHHELQLLVQQRLPSNMVVDVGYSGSLGRNLLWTRDLNTVPTEPVSIRIPDPTRPGTVLPTAFLTPVTGYLNINQYEAAATSNYHSLQVSAKPPLSAGSNSERPGLGPRR